MNCIKLLPEIVANQIAAGEVVNEPSPVFRGERAGGELH